jgi:hypothetical protein
MNTTVLGWPDSRPECDGDDPETGTAEPPDVADDNEYEPV